MSSYRHDLADRLRAVVAGGSTAGLADLMTEAADALAPQPPDAIGPTRVRFSAVWFSDFWSHGIVAVDAFEVDQETADRVARDYVDRTGQRAIVRRIETTPIAEYRSTDPNRTDPEGGTPA